VRLVRLVSIVVVLAAGACAKPAVQRARPSPASVPTAPAASAEPSSDSRPLAPDFSLDRLDGGTFRLADYRGKLPVVLNFWAPW
jgi:hypothetical protein